MAINIPLRTREFRVLPAPKPDDAVEPHANCPAAQDNGAFCAVCAQTAWRCDLFGGGGAEREKDGRREGGRERGREGGKEGERESAREADIHRLLF